VLARLHVDSMSGLSDQECAGYLETFRTTIHGRKKRVRYSMNGALISNSLRSAAFQAEVLEIAKAIGNVEVDHGETGCKTPDAAAYILRTAKRRL
jgi:hypothetical protein